MYLPHLLSSYRVSGTKNSNGVVVDTKTQVYTNIKCMIWLNKNENNVDNDLGRDVDTTNYNVMTENGDYQLGDIIELLITPSYSIGSYKISNIDYNYSKISNGVGNIYFSVKKRDVS